MLDTLSFVSNDGVFIRYSPIMFALLYILMSREEFLLDYYHFDSQIFGRRWSIVYTGEMNQLISWIFIKLNSCWSSFSFILQIICIVIMAFLSVCSYYTVFKIRIFDFYLLAPHHQTDENSLLFCGMSVIFTDFLFTIYLLRLAGHFVC